MRSACRSMHASSEAQMVRSGPKQRLRSKRTARGNAEALIVKLTMLAVCGRESADVGYSGTRTHPDRKDRQTAPSRHFRQLRFGIAGNSGKTAGVSLFLRASSR